MDCELLIIARWARERSADVEFLRLNLPDLAEHVWLSTSGTLATAGASQWIALSKKALLASAAAVNQHLSVTAQDSWGLVLPLAHVGGLGILARAHLAGQEVKPFLQDKWSPSLIKSCQWLSLVPTQVHDIVASQIPAPAGLKGVIVGGDRLADELKHKAVALGWPILPSFGLTECGSQVATARSHDRGEKLFLLPHIQASVDSEDILSIDSPALYTAKAQVSDGVVSVHTRDKGPWKTQDRVLLGPDGSLQHLGRADQTIKIRGEKVEIAEIEKQLNGMLGFQVIVLALPDDRDGMRLMLISEKNLELSLLNESLLPHQKIQDVKYISQFPRTELGKIKRGELRALIER
jgi:O-succinylbenzoic acid--CoA ligase